MTDYNASEIDRLVREGTEDNERMTPGPWKEDGHAWSPWVHREVIEGVVHSYVFKCGSREDAIGVTRQRNNLPAMVAALSAAKAEVERLTNALTKISAIRDSIVGCQGFNFSEHAYPLVAVLDDAGFKGAGYEIASKNLGTLIEQRNAAERERDALSARVRELELTEEDRERLLEVISVVAPHDSGMPGMVSVESIALLDRLVKGGR